MLTKEIWYLLATLLIYRLSGKCEDLRWIKKNKKSDLVDNWHHFRLFQFIQVIVC